MATAHTAASWLRSLHAPACALKLQKMPPRMLEQRKALLRCLLACPGTCRAVGATYLRTCALSMEYLLIRSQTRVVVVKTLFVRLLLLPTSD
jgi:hypothetical protein